MSEPIISPWIFYWVNVLDSLKFFISTIIIIGIIAIITTAIIMVSTCFDLDELKEKSKFLKIFQKAIISILILMAVYSFTPSKETIITMLVADNVTKENIEITTDTIKNVTDYIFDKINEESIEK